MDDNNGLTKAAALYTFALIWLTLDVIPFQDANVLSEFTTVRSNSSDPGLPAYTPSAAITWPKAVQVMCFFLALMVVAVVVHVPTVPRVAVAKFTAFVPLLPCALGSVELERSPSIT